MTGFDPEDRARLKGLDERIEAAQDRAHNSPLPLASEPPEASASRLGYELLGAVLAGTGLGWLFDGMVGTGPYGLLTGLFAGFIAGAANAWRVTMGVERAVGLRPRDDEDKTKDQD